MSRAALEVFKVDVAAALEVMRQVVRARGEATLANFRGALAARILPGCGVPLATKTAIVRTLLEETDFVCTRRNGVEFWRLP